MTADETDYQVGNTRHDEEYERNQDRRMAAWG